MRRGPSSAVSVCCRRPSRGVGRRPSSPSVVGRRALCALRCHRRSSVVGSGRRRSPPDVLGRRRSSSVFRRRPSSVTIGRLRQSLGRLRRNRPTSLRTSPDARIVAICGDGGRCCPIDRGSATSARTWSKSRSVGHRWCSKLPNLSQNPPQAHAARAALPCSVAMWLTRSEACDVGCALKGEFHDLWNMFTKLQRRQRHFVT